MKYAHKIFTLSLVRTNPPIVCEAMTPSNKATIGNEMLAIENRALASHNRMLT